jgi:hypothetical protein
MQVWTRWGAALAASAALSAACGGAQAQTVAGEWHGTVDFNGNTAQVGVTLKAKPGGGYEGRWIGPRNTLPLKDIKLDKGTLSFSNGSGNYSGRWDATRKAWVGRWIFPMTIIVPPGAPPPTSLPPIPTTPLVLTAGKPKLR